MIFLPQKMARDESSPIDEINIIGKRKLVLEMKRETEILVLYINQRRKKKEKSNSMYREI